MAQDLRSFTEMLIFAPFLGTTDYAPYLAK